ncbi:hypothetical protein ASF12_32925 [Paenibacillus sp. Leaf72]|nr:hypothetical protein ASF12_32925 [Paenibacillus sp. Leaf72]
MKFSVRTQALAHEERMAEVTLADINLQDSFWTLHYFVDKQAVNVGGLTLYGSLFGNHDQDIVSQVHLSDDY